LVSSLSAVGRAWRGIFCDRPPFELPVRHSVPHGTLGFRFVVRTVHGDGDIVCLAILAAAIIFRVGADAVEQVSRFGLSVDGRPAGELIHGHLGQVFRHEFFELFGVALLIVSKSVERQGQIDVGGSLSQHVFAVHAP
jgi:hypothetical protein